MTEAGANIRARGSALAMTRTTMPNRPHRPGITRPVGKSTRIAGMVRIRTAPNCATNHSEKPVSGRSGEAA